MRHFVYFSSQAATSGKALSGDLMKAGRMDIALHIVVNSFFISHQIREDVKLHLIFYGMPDPPKHIEITLKQSQGVPKEGQSLDISKKDVAGMIKKMLYKYKDGQKTEVFSGCFIEKKSFLNVIEKLLGEGKDIFVLDKKGEDIREIDIEGEPVFIIGDHNGLPKQEMKRLKDVATKVSVGPKMYFASQTVAVVNNELDRRGI